ncbi:MAG: phosphatidate cytidylyltransferase [Bacteroidia bacterium]|nr:phosphatidate cytidylyltransferase [Bacteroidia bacterium]
MTDFLYFLIISISGLILFTITELMYHRLKVDAEITRKTAHVGSGLISLLFPVYIHNQWLVLLICGFFQLLLILSRNYGFLKSINAVPRKTYGSIAYPIVIYLVYLIWYYTERNSGITNNTYIYYFLPIIIMAICDPAAALVGKFYPIYKFKKFNKSIGGSIAFWIISFFITVVFLFKSAIFNQLDIIWVSVFIATTSTVTELYSKKGFDNLLIPFAVLLAMYIAEHFF